MQTFWKTSRLIFALLALPVPAHATFHLWSVNELYSSADGSVQFIEFFTSSSLQEALAGHAVTCSGQLGTSTFNFPSNLPSGTANKTFIVGTANLASIPGGVKPDYVFTNSTPFLFLNPGATNTVMIVGTLTTPAAYTNLPTDGVKSLVRTGSGSSFATVATNSPKNYLSQSNSIVPAAFSSVTRSGPAVVLSFATATGINGTAGPNYALQANDTFGTANWSTISNVIGDGTVKNISISPTGSVQVFRLKSP